MNFSPDWIPVISGAVGAGGAVAAQSVAALATSRREDRAAQARRADARAAAFADAKRTLFVKVLQAIDGYLADYDNLLVRIADGEATASTPTGVLDIAKVEDWRAEFDLLARDVAEPLNDCLRALRAFDGVIGLFGATDPTRLSNAERVVRERRADLRDVMLVSLNLDDPPTEATKRSRKKAGAS